MRVTAFDVLQQFGGSKRGSSDHCPLWCRLERGDKEKHVAIVEEMRTNEDFLDADILQRIERLGKPPAPPEFEDMLMSEAFENEESDDDLIQIAMMSVDLKKKMTNRDPLRIVQCPF